jgi:hypothetical protein
MESTTPKGSDVTPPPKARKGEHGQIIILFVLVLVVIMGAAALVIDVGVLRNANQNLWNALDAGALAGVSYLPDDPSNAKKFALQYADENYPGGLQPADVTVSYRCVIGSTGGSPKLSDVPSACDPGAGAAWTCNATMCVTVCDPAPPGNKCNSIVLQSAATVPYNFGPAVGVETGTTQTVLSAACKSPCGPKPAAKVDLVLIVDRTGSMSGVDTTNAKSAAQAVRKAYNPAEQWMALGMLGPSQSGTCVTQKAGSIGTANAPADLRRWVPIGLTGTGAPNNANYAAAGSAMDQGIICYTNSSTGTDLSDPIRMATYELLNNGRSGVTKGIILMTDGQPNNAVSAPGGMCSKPTSYYNAEAKDAAQDAKSAGIELFTIGFGLANGEVDENDCEGNPQNAQALRQLLASMATDSVDNGCPGTSNDDGDHFFCIPKSATANPNLADLFKQAANALVGSSRLIQLP